MSDDRNYRPSKARLEAVASFYEKHPYPHPATDLEAFRRGDGTLLGSPSHFSPLIWPQQRAPATPNILVAGCGTSQATKYALLNPHARVTGIDLSEASLNHARGLAQRYGLENLTLHQLSLGDANQLQERFQLIVSTGVLHHLPDPQVGLNSLAACLAEDGVLHVMVYAKYGRTGVYMMQHLGERLGVLPDDDPIRHLQRLARALPPLHPLHMFSQRTDDLNYAAGVADALLHPQDRAFTTQDIHHGLDVAGLKLDRWLLQAPYLPQCCRLDGFAELMTEQALTRQAAHEIMELARGTMLTHEFTAVLQSGSRSLQFSPDALSDMWLFPYPGSKCNELGLPPGVAAQLWHPAHGYQDIKLPLSRQELALFQLIGDGIAFSDWAANAGQLDAVLFCEQLWEHDQILVAPAAA